MGAGWPPGKTTRGSRNGNNDDNDDNDTKSIDRIAASMRIPTDGFMR
jgi:hypothetical protein